MRSMVFVSYSESWAPLPRLYFLCGRHFAHKTLKKLREPNGKCFCIVEREQVKTDDRSSRYNHCVRYFSHVMGPTSSGRSSVRVSRIPNVFLTFYIGNISPSISSPGGGVIQNHPQARSAPSDFPSQRWPLVIWWILQDPTVVRIRTSLRMISSRWLPTRVAQINVWICLNNLNIAWSDFCRYKENILLSVLLYFHRISDNRMASTPLRNPRMFEELWGQNNFQRVILTTTVWDRVDEELGGAREKVLNGKYWRHMLDYDSTMSRFMRTRGSTFTVIDSFIDAANKRSSSTTRRTDEYLPWASAGRKLASDMEAHVRQRVDLLYRITNEIERADGDLQGIFAAGTSEASSRVRNHHEMRKLKQSLGDRLFEHNR